MKKIISLLVLTLCVSANAQEIESQWNGVKVAVLGDSISDPSFAKKSGWRCWWDYLQDILGVEVNSFAKNGSQTNRLVNQAMNLSEKDADVILIFCGTNDFNASVPLGEWFKEDTLTVNKNGKASTLKHRTPVMTDSTFCGRINITMDYLKTNFPTKQIILITPIHRGYAKFGEKNVQPDESFSNKNGIFIDSYVEKLHQAGSVWSAPVIDLFSTSGIIPNYPSNSIYINKKDTDRLHPNTQGHKRIAYCIAYNLLVFPALLP